MWQLHVATVMVVVAINMKWGECIDRKPFGGVWDLDDIVKTDSDPNLVVQVRELFSFCSNFACSSAFVFPPHVFHQPHWDFGGMLWQY